MADPYLHRYADLTPQRCDREALLLMQEAVNRTRAWEDVVDRLLALRRVKRYAPRPVVEVRPLRSLLTPAEELAGLD